ncbi:MAG: peptidylprolyl isomerase [Roseburia sp.]|nr:peptidylprolyl isomerase [Roseburia sp.]MCM1098352.1 peptidylprolyl isomerase [Ruminococcus flavefaciens]
MLADDGMIDGNGTEKREKRNRERSGGSVRRIFALAACLAALLCLSACGDGGVRVVFTTGFGKDEVFRIGSAGCSRAELMVYLTNIQNRYENVYGAEVWNVAREDETLEDNVKETVLARVAQIKTMCLLAESLDVELDETETRLTGQAAREYFGSLNETEIRLMGVTEETVRKLYEEYALADKVYQYLIQDINPEISDDEARTITVQHILLRTWTTDGSGARVAYGEDVKRSVYEKAVEIRRLAAEGEEDFLDLASRYGENPEITFSFGKGEITPELEEAAFSLETGEISQVIETENGYHIIKCISTFDREQTELNKLTIVEERRRDVFGQEYDAFAETLMRQLNTKLWEKIAMLHDEEVTTADFFAVYAKYFPD